MTRTKRGRKKKRKATPGSFKPGPDCRRHVFTAQDCRLGYWVAAIKHPELRQWLKMKIRVYYHERSKHGKESEVRGHNGHTGTAVGCAEGSHGSGGDPDGAVACNDDIPY